MKALKKTSIGEAIARVSDWQGKDIKQELVPCGITNPNYKVDVEGNCFFLKIPGAGTEAFIDRDNCHAANIIGMETTCGPKVNYYFEDTGVEIWEWLEGYRQVVFGDIYNEKIFTKIAESARDFHNCGKTLPIKQTLFEQAWQMIERSKGGGYLPPWYDKMVFLLKEIEEAIQKGGIEFKPSHNDYWTNNFLYNDETGDFKLIDFEYASMNDPYNDLGCFSTTNYLTEAMDVLLSNIYHRGWSEKGFAKLKLYKIVADIKWGFWALQQYLFSDVKFDFMNWYGMKTARLQHLWQDPRLDYWLNLVSGKPIFRQVKR
ncbi:MAG: choline kinase family protein [Spirochaetaceae bacterium]|nr:choline kinase family protein [Spirochaetaceae bacterium]